MMQEFSDRDPPGAGPSRLGQLVLGLVAWGGMALLLFMIASNFW